LKNISGDINQLVSDYSTYLIEVVLFTVVCDSNEVIGTGYWVFAFSGNKQEDGLCEMRSVEKEV
jgi:hypothetical protein